MADYRIRTVFDTKVEGDAQKVFEDIKSNLEKIKALSIEETEIVSKSTGSYANAVKQIEEIKKKKEILVENEKRILEIQTMMSQLNLDRKQNKELQDMIKLLRNKNEEIKNDPSLKNAQERIKAKEEELRLLDAEQDKQAYSKRIVNEIRDDFRKKGLFGTLKGFNINSGFDKRISRNDELINKNEGEMKDIDKKLASNDLSDSERENLMQRKQQLQSDTDAKRSSNMKMAIAQAAINTAISAVKKVGNVANEVFKTMGFDLKSTFKDIVATIAKELKETGMASFATGSTLFTNAEARTQQMKYGLSNTSNYALTRTMEMLNMKSDEDLVYMNETQKEAFNSLLDRYKGWYEQLESTGALIKLQQAQLDFKMFKEEMSMKLLNWFADHKETIFTILEFTMNVLEFIANAVEGLLNLFGKTNSSSRNSLGTSDTYLSNTNSNININVNNTNNATANLNSKAELDASLNSANNNVVKSIATALQSR